MSDPFQNSPAWFEAIYTNARELQERVPWDRHAPHPELVAWLGDHSAGGGLRALVVGSGFGDDAEAVAAAGYETTAFDVSPTAVEGARVRYPESEVSYLVADLLTQPPAWDEGFDLVVEIHTVQAMPMVLRDRAIAAIRDMVGAGGTLLAIAYSRPDHDTVPPGPPWPLSQLEVESFAAEGLLQTSLRHENGEQWGWWVGVFQRPNF
jgi:SAM-dependent methyltransferase